jgi:ATP phosphoribosyltransferase-like protein
VPGASAEDVARGVLAAGGVAGLRGPTIARVFPKDPSEREWFAVTVVVSEDVLLTTVEALRRAGASDVSITQVRYVFEHRSWTFEALKRQLQGAGATAESGAREKTTA